MPTFAELKALGDAASRASPPDWKEARKQYTAALALDSTSEAAGTLFSNRAAALISLHLYDLALVDAQMATKIRPSWSRGYARLGEAHSRLSAFDHAEKAYQMALSIETDAASKARYVTALQNIASHLRSLRTPAQHNLLTAKEGQVWYDRLAQAKRRGYRVRDGSAVSLAEFSLSLCRQGLAGLNHLVLGPDGMPTSGLRGCEHVSDLAESLLCEPRGFVMKQGSDPSRHVLQMIPKLVTFQYMAFNILELMRFDQTPKSIIAYFVARRNPHEMTSIRMPLTIVIKGNIAMGFLQHQTGDIGGALKRYRDVMGLFEEGLRVWPNEDPQDRGTMFSSTYIRCTRVLFAQCLEASHAKGKTKPDAAAKLDEIEKLALQTIKDCNDDPCDTRYGGNFVTGYEIMPKVHSYANLGYAGRAILPDIEESRKAAEAFKKALDLCPKDHPDYGIMYYHMAYFNLRAGGQTIGEIFDEAAKCEQALNSSKEIFGDPVLDFESRNFVRLQCQGLRDWIDSNPEVQQLPVDEILEVTVKPVPTVFTKGWSLDQIQTGAEELVPREFWTSLDGFIGLCDTVS